MTEKRKKEGEDKKKKWTTSVTNYTYTTAYIKYFPDGELQVHFYFFSSF